jgi:Zn-dependent peptidase ImmA (M78 family)
VGAPIFKSADELLVDLGITEPEELDVEVIAQHCRATIVYKPLKGCAARITGNEERAIITIDSECRRERQRFSAGHELGHWMFDRGKSSLYSCDERVFLNEWSRFNPETRANRYASDLLMPDFMFKPRATALKKVDFETVKSLAHVFDTSLTATAIRLVERGPLPSMLVCSSCDGVEWFVHGDGAKGLRPANPGPDTFAHDILFGGEKEASGEVLAAAWFEHDIADRYQIWEHSIRGFEDRVLSLLWWRTEKMLMDLDDYEERRAAKRWDDRD